MKIPSCSLRPWHMVRSIRQLQNISILYMCLRTIIVSGKRIPITRINAPKTNEPAVGFVYTIREYARRKSATPALYFDRLVSPPTHQHASTKVCNTPCESKFFLQPVFRPKNSTRVIIVHVHTCFFWSFRYRIPARMPRYFSSISPYAPCTSHRTNFNHLTILITSRLVKESHHKILSNSLFGKV